MSYSHDPFRARPRRAAQPAGEAIPAPPAGDGPPTLEALRAEAEALGIDVNPRWREAGLSKAIEAAKAAGGE